MCTKPVNVGGNFFPCGKCFECCEANANMWAQRCMDEAKLHKENCLITLTYEVTDGNLYKRDVQKFIKRLRRRIEPKKIRFYLCGEYGGRRNRPHYHVVCFGWFPPDAKYVCTKKGVDYFGSEQLAEIWRSDEEARQNGRQGGFVSVATLNFRACRYCCKYLQKLDERPHKVMPFTLMSRRPGIGAQAVKPEMLINGTMYCNGKSLPIPKFYVDKLEKFGYNVDVLKARRKYIYQNKQGTFYPVDINGYRDYEATRLAVDSARRRGEIIENRLRKMR